MKVKSICGIILAASDPEALAEFYAQALGLEFQREAHGALTTHFGVDIGEVHFGIHPPENLGRGEVGNARSSVAFNVDSVAGAAARLEALGAEQVLPPHDEGFGTVATYRDPEGNLFEIVELDYEFGGPQ